MTQDDWILPELEPTIELLPGELLLLDWCICATSHILPADNLDTYLAWHDLRLDIWRGITIAIKDKTAKLRLSVPEAKALLAVAPTTFRWGTGPDCGFELKRKLAEYLDKYQ